MPYVRLERHEAMGEEYFALPGEPGVRTQMLRYQEGEVVRFRYPDGVADERRVRMKEFVWEAPRDPAFYGHHYELPGVVVASVHGLDFWVPLDEVDVLLIAVDEVSAYPARMPREA